MIELRLGAQGAKRPSDAGRSLSRGATEGRSDGTETTELTRPRLSSVVVADSSERRAEAYAIRYRAYVECGAIAPSPAESFRDRYDDEPSCTTHLLYRGERAVASIRACVLSDAFGRAPIPALEVYAREIEASLGKGRTIVEANRFVILPDYQGPSLAPKLALFRCIVDAARAAGADFILVAVRARHAEFYERLRFRRISDAKKYPGLDVRMVLLACECADACRNKGDGVLASVLA